MPKNNHQSPLSIVGFILITAFGIYFLWQFAQPPICNCPNEPLGQQPVPCCQPDWLELIAGGALTVFGSACIYGTYKHIKGHR